MTLHRPEETTLAALAFKGLSVKSIIVCAVMISGAFYSMRGDVKEDHSRLDAHDKRFDTYRDRIDDKVSLETYRADQHRQADDIHDIKVAIEGIHAVLESRQ